MYSNLLLTLFNLCQSCLLLSSISFLISAWYVPLSKIWILIDLLSVNSYWHCLFDILPCLTMNVFSYCCFYFFTITNVCFSYFFTSFSLLILLKFLNKLTSIISKSLNFEIWKWLFLRKSLKIEGAWFKD